MEAKAALESQSGQNQRSWFDPSNQVISTTSAGERGAMARSCRSGCSARALLEALLVFIQENKTPEEKEYACMMLTDIDEKTPQAGWKFFTSLSSPQRPF
jgi:hypothetical protein